MTETSISMCRADDVAYIYTSSKHHARSIRKRLDEAGADYEMSEHQSGDVSWKFEVDKDDCRHPKYVLYAS